MSFDYLKYRQGYSIGVGGVVLHENKVLLVKRASEPRKGDWALPGGYIEHDETIYAAVQREVLEEAGIVAEVTGLIGLFNIARDDENSTYLMFLMQANNHEAQADMEEVDDARFFSLQELEDLPMLQWLSRSIITPILQGQRTILNPFSFPNDMPLDKAVLFAGALHKFD